MIAFFKKLETAHLVRNSIILTGGYLNDCCCWFIFVVVLIMCVFLCFVFVLGYKSLFPF